MIIYIAGKITGDSNYKAKFLEAEEKLKSEGHTVLNPAVLPERGLTYGQSMNICFAMLRECDAVYLLKDWTISKGAIAEHSAAKIRGLRIIYQEEQS